MNKAVIYQILPRLWGNGTFASIDDASLGYFRSMGITHLWYTGIIRHAVDRAFVKGNPGSPYAISDYYDVNPYLAENPRLRIAEFENLIERTHHQGMKVIIDFVPNHVSRDYGISRCRRDIHYLGDDDDKSVHWKKENDFYYYPSERLTLPQECIGDWDEFPARATGNCYSPSPSSGDWYDTVKINYCDFHTDTWDKMYNVVRYWIQKGVDGFRCDMVELVPASFMKWLITGIKSEFPDVVFIGEVYSRESYRSFIEEVHFDYLYDKSGLYDSLRSIIMRNADDEDSAWEGNVNPWESTSRITSNWQYLSNLQPHMLNFLENHDEQRFASGQFGLDASRVFPALYVSALFNTAPFMMYFGQEVGEKGGCDGRTSIFNIEHGKSIDKLYQYIHGENSLDSEEINLLERYRSVLLMAAKPFISKGLIFDLCYCNAGSDGFDSDRHFAFLRKSGENAVLFFANFSSVEASVMLRIPPHATEILGISERSVRIETGPRDVSVLPVI